MSRFEPPLERPILNIGVGSMQSDFDVRSAGGQLGDALGFSLESILNQHLLWQSSLATPDRDDNGLNM